MPLAAEYYKRRLPHWQPAEGVFHVVLRLHDSLPQPLVQKLNTAHRRLLLEIEQTIADTTHRDDLKQQEYHRYFLEFDHHLDQARTGPDWLKNERLAQIVKDCFLFWHDCQRYKLVSLCVMPNHVHAILYKIKLPLFRILQTIKTYTAKQANLELGRTGNRFWQREYYDHQIRGRKEFNNQLQYVLNNPVAARLVESWEDWPATWCNPVWV